MGRVGSFLFICIGSYLLDKAGLRVTMIIYSVVMLLSNGLQSVSKDKETAFILITLGKFLNGCSGVITFIAPPVIAARWFPPGERITASASMIFAASLGDDIASFIGPTIVEKPKYGSISIVYNSTQVPGTANEQHVVNAVEILDGLINFLCAQCEVSAVLLIATLAYYPDKPPTVPSTSAAILRFNYKKSFRVLFRNKHLLFLMLVFGLMCGVYSSWFLVIDMVNEPLGPSQLNAGSTAFYIVLTGGIFGLIMARCADLFTKRIKHVLLAMTAIVIGASLWTALIATEILPFSKWQWNLSAIVSGALLSASFALWYEVVCEMSFPIPGGITNGISDSVSLIFENIFFATMYIPFSDHRWLTWTMFVCALLGFVTLMFTHVTYIRTNIDIEAEEVHGNQRN